jgi:hypothetical protein
MKKTISLIAGGLLLATGAKAQVPQVPGIWELDLTSSVLPATFPLASETRSYDLRTGHTGGPRLVRIVGVHSRLDLPRGTAARAPFLSRVRRFY